MKYNFHTHTYRCLHATGTERDYVRQAVNNHFDSIGFSDHAPFPDHDYGYRMQFGELDDYIHELDMLKDEFMGIINIFKGLEIEYLPQYEKYYRELLNNKGLDYLALGEHFYMGGDGEIHNIFFAESTSDYLEYADNVCKAMNTGLFAFAAHPDIMFINPFAWDDNSRTACERIIDCAEQTDTVLEINANGFRRERMHLPDGIRYPYPHEKFWNMVRGRNIRVIIGSDCHVCEQLSDRYVDRAVSWANDIGLDVMDTLTLKSMKGSV